jgi:hypothetical protein
MRLEMTAAPHKEAAMSMLMMKSKMAAVGMGVAVAAAVPAAAIASQHGHARVVRAAASTVNWKIAMKAGSAYPQANGSAQYQSQPGQRDLQLEVQRIRSLTGNSVVFSAAGRRLGTAKVSNMGQADITRNTELGQNVPSIAHGSRVTVRTAAGVLIASGRF